MLRLGHFLSQFSETSDRLDNASKIAKQGYNMETFSWKPPRMPVGSA